MKDYRKFIEQWRETANRLVAKDPDDRAGQALIKCANDLESEMSTNRGVAAAAAIVFAATTLLAEVRQDLEEYKQDRSVYTTNTLVPTRSMGFEQPAIPNNEHNPEERGDTELVFAVAVSSVSGSNVAAHVVSSSATGQHESLKRT
jgi:hypothetical protein